MHIYNREKILISTVMELSNTELQKALNSQSEICKFYNNNQLNNMSEKCMYEKLYEEEYDYIHPCFDMDDKDAKYEEETKKDIAFKIFKKLLPEFFIYVLYQDKNIESNVEIIKSNIIKNLAISISDDKSKLSIHANYPNIILTRDSMSYIIKTHFNKWCNSLKTDIKYYTYKQFLQFIDLGIYKTNMSLRAVNSFKPDGSGRLNIFMNDNKLDHYFTYIYTEENNIILSKKEETQLLLPKNISIMKEKVDYEDEIINYIKQIIKNPCDIDSPLSYDIHHKIIVQYEDVCGLCNKDSHKNKHMFIFKEDGRLTIYKSGNKRSCTSHSTILEFNKTTIDIVSACVEYILSLDILYKTNKNIYIGWNGLRWIKLEVKDKSETEYSIERFIFELRKKLPEDYYNLIDKVNSKTTNIITKIKLSIPIITLNRYEHSLFIPFNNGIYNISTGNFISGLSAKKYMLYETIDRDYNEIETDEIKKELYNIIDMIQPDVEENKENKNRFEKCLASTILYRDKRIIYTFIGMTKSGKSTIKLLLLNTLGPGLSDKCEANSFLETTNTGPKHDIANTNNKTLICISELKQGFKLSAQTFKKLTEPTIAARKNFSTESNNQINNVATFIFDCNSVIDFTEHTPSVAERLCTITFNIRFSTGDEDENTIGDDREIRKADHDLNTKILSGKYNDEFFRYLSLLYRKHFKNGFILESYCHPSLPITETISICKRELISTNFITEEFTKEVEKYIREINKNIKFVSHNDRRKMSSTKHYLSTNLVLKYEDLLKINNEKYKNLKQCNIQSYFNEMSAINYLLLILRDDYVKMLKCDKIDSDIKEREKSIHINVVDLDALNEDI
jgi:hypothetical protein